MDALVVRAFLASAFLLSCQCADAAIGRTAGQASVTPSGSAVYSIPLWSPPGSASIQIPLSLSYDSSRENGVVGMGFALGGFSAITRCPKTIAQDGTAVGVQRVASDGYCLDGQRLRLESGTYGAAGSVYRTEIESYAKVVAPFANASGPISFEVRHKDGRIFEYANTGNSCIEYVGSTAVREWALSAVRDRAGNRIEISYIEDGSPNGGYRPNEITYTSNVAAGLSTAPYKIKFVYEAATRPDPIYAFEGGGPANELKRLERIEVQHNSSIVRQYLLVYTGTTGASGRSRLASIQECAATTGDCFTATQFTWTNSTASFGAEQNPSQTLGSAFTHMIDVNADGRDDLVYVSHVTSGSGTWRIRKANSAGGFDAEINTGLTNTNYIQAQSLEWDGDGRLDLMVPYASNRWHVFRSNGSGFDTPFDTGITVAAGDVTRALDINGDGRDDLVRLTSSGQARVWVRYRGATNFDASETSLWTAWSPNVTFFSGFAVRPHYLKYRSRIRRGDFNGDRREDFIATLNEFDPESGTNTRYNAGFSAGVYMGQLEFSADLGGNHLWADVNGDGNTDIVWVTVGGQVRFLLGSGIGYTAPIAGPSTSGYVAGSSVISDYDGDGRDDLLIPYNTGSLLHSMRSTGTGIAAGVSTGIPWSGQALQSANLDGDFYGDLAINASLSFRYRVHSPTPSDLLDTATDAFGVAADFNYAPFADPTVYTKGSGTTYPQVDYPGPGLLVKQLIATDGTGSGSTYTLNFTYEGARQDFQGRGFLGVARRNVVDSREGYNLKSEEDYRQDFPYIGLTSAARLKQSTGTVMREVSNTWSKLDYSSGTTARSFPYISSSTATARELGGTYNGTHFATVTRSVAAIDTTSGTVTDSTVTTTEVATGLNPTSSKSERVYHSSILNDTANWCLGRPQTTQFIQTHSLAGGGSLTRTLGSTWDGLNCRPTQAQIEPGDLTWQVTIGLGYDAFGNLNSTSVTGASMSARTTTMNFGTRGQFPETITNALSQASTQAFNYDFGVATSATDPNSLMTSWTLDTFGRRTLETRPDGTKTSWTIATCGACDARVRYSLTEQEQTTGGGAIVTDNHYFDQFDRRLYEYRQLPGGGLSITTGTYDSRGRLIRMYVPYWSGSSHNGYREFSYDALDRTVTEALYTAGGALDRTTTYAYNGLSSTITDPKTYTTTRYVAPWGDLARVTDAATGNTNYQYNAFGQLKEVTDAYGNSASSMTYNVRGMKTGQTDLDTGGWTYLPNALGEVINVRDAKTTAPAWTTIMGYDALGRMTSRQDVPEATTSTFTFGTSAALKNIGRLSGLSGAGYSESYLYDSVGRLQTTTINSDASYQIDYDYNNEGTLNTLTYPTSTQSVRFKLKYFYSYGALTSVRKFTGDVLGTTYWTLTTADARGNAIDETLGNTVRVISGFDALTGEIDYRQSGVGGGTGLQNLDYSWDKNGNLTQRQDLRQSLSESFAYDALNRLDYTSGVSSLDLTYDLIGNITNKSDVGSYTYHATKKHAVTAAGSLSFGYDLNGNVNSRNGQSISWYSYNLPNTINASGSNSSQFFYTPDRARWKQQASYGGTSETTIYIGDVVEKRTLGTKTSWRHLIATPSGMAAEYVRSVDTGPTYTEDTYYFTHDQLGSIDSVTNAVGTVQVRMSFAAFGQRRGEAGWTGNPTTPDWTAITHTTRRGYTEHEHLDNLSLIHMNGRVYDPVVGRFLSADPFVQAPDFSQSFNRYAYVFNNPLTFIDPSGFNCEKSCKPQKDSPRWTYEWSHDPRVTVWIRPLIRPQSEMVVPVKPRTAAQPEVVGPSVSDFVLNSTREIALSYGENSWSLAYWNVVIGGWTDAANDATKGDYDAAALKVGTAVFKPARILARELKVARALPSPRAWYLQHATDSKLRRRIEALYRQNAKIGNGGTADALRHELRTGELLSPSGHAQKAIEMRNGLMSDIASGRLNETDTRIARELLSDLQRALTGN